MRIKFHDVKVSNNIKLNPPDKFFIGTEQDGDSDWTISFKLDPLMLVYLRDPSFFTLEDRQEFTENLMSRVIPLCIEFSTKSMNDYKIKYGLSDEDVDNMRATANELLAKANLGVQL